MTYCYVCAWDGSLEGWRSLWYDRFRWQSRNTDALKDWVGLALEDSAFEVFTDSRISRRIESSVADMERVASNLHNALYPKDDSDLFNRK